MFKNKIFPHNKYGRNNMTQKELAYVEDAIGHESNIIKILQETIKNIQDENLISFLENKLETHVSMKQKLINKLEEKANV